jgi:hypothetical protein
MLSNIDIDNLVEKMNIPNFKGCFYKDKLFNIESNSSYIINLNSELDENNKINKGSHWVALVTDDNNKSIYFDAYGVSAPTEIKNLIKSSQYKFAETRKNIQSLMSNLCGFFCLGFIYFLNVSQFKTNNIIIDASIYLDLFEDLDKVNDVYKNEFILSLFFTDKDSKKLLFSNNNINLHTENKITNNYDIENKKLRR